MFNPEKKLDIQADLYMVNLSQSSLRTKPASITLLHINGDGAAFYSPLRLPTSAQIEYECAIRWKHMQINLPIKLQQLRTFHSGIYFYEGSFTDIAQKSNWTNWLYAYSSYLSRVRETYEKAYWTKLDTPLTLDRYA